MRPIISLSLLLLVIVAPIKAYNYAQQQAYVFERIGTSSGLSNSTITSIVQDSIGFIWIGTENGLDRFDGQSFRSFVHSPHLPCSPLSNHITSLLIAGRHNLWVGTSQGLNLYDPTLECFNPIQLKLERHGETWPLITALMEDSKGNIWVGTSGNGFFCLGRDNNSQINFSSYSLLHSVECDYISSFAELPNGNILVGTNGCGMYMVEHESLNIVHFQPQTKAKHPFPASGVNDFLVDSDLGCLILTNQGIYQYNWEDEEIVPFTPNRIISGVGAPWHMLAASHGNYFIATNSGLVRYRPALEEYQVFKHNTNDKNTMASSSASIVFEDMQGNLWVAHPDAGISLSTRSYTPFEHYQIYGPEAQQEHTRFVNSILSFGSTLWLGTNRGLYKYNRNNGNATLQPLPGPDPTPAVLSVSGRGNELWVGTYNMGASYINLETGYTQHYSADYTLPNTLPSTIISDIHRDSKGRLWFATAGGGLALLNPTDSTFQTITHTVGDEDSFANDYCIGIHEDNNGRLWVGTFNGLSVVDPDSLTIQTYRHKPADSNSLSQNWVYSVVTDTSGIAWIGTDWGLNRLDYTNGSFQHFTTEHGLADNSILGILTDSDGNLWLSSKRGLTKFNPENGETMTFTESDGLQSNEFKIRSFHQSAAGELFFGGANGVNAFYPKNIKRNQAPPPISFTQLLVMNKLVNPNMDDANIINQSIMYSPTVNLTHRHSVITIEFAALNFINASQNQYAYMLEGFDNDWRYIKGARSATYTNLNSGTYTFRVKASNNHGVWNQTGIATKIIIAPPFWRTWWAWTIYIIIVLTMLILLNRYTLIGVKRKNELLLERIKHEKNDELNRMKIDFFTNISHEFRTPLTLILGPIERMVSTGQLNQAYLNIIQRNANYLLKLINQLLDFRRTEANTMQLRVAYADISGFVREVYLAFEHLANQRGIRYTLNTPDEPVSCWFDADKIEKILLNLISNAFKHTPADGDISIELSNSNPDSISISVTDNGLGIDRLQQERIFEMFYRIPERSMGVGSGLGLALARNLAQLHGGSLEVVSQPSKGSCFTLSLPKSSIYTKEQHQQGSMVSLSDSFYQSVENEFVSPANIAAELQGANNPSVQTHGTVLVIDDNKDIRLLLADMLQTRYTVMQAENGEQGIARALSASPDIIISDIMMPGIDGIELCRRLKTDIAASHIPIILLTANVEEATRMEGLEEGADGYLTKPVSRKELLAVVDNIVTTQRNLYNKIKGEFNLNPVQVTTTATDSHFLARIMTFVEGNIQESNLDVLTLAGELGLSRSAFYRKMQRVLGQSPNEFVRSVRLKKAATILRSGQHQVAEVAFAVGFNDPLYFSRCFKAQFGVSPTKFLERG